MLGYTIVAYILWTSNLTCSKANNKKEAQRHHLCITYELKWYECESNSTFHNQTKRICLLKAPRKHRSPLIQSRQADYVEHSTKLIFICFALFGYVTFHELWPPIKGVLILQRVIIEIAGISDQVIRQNYVFECRYINFAILVIIVRIVGIVKYQSLLA